MNYADELNHYKKFLKGYGFGLRVARMKKLPHETHTCAECTATYESSEAIHDLHTNLMTERYSAFFKIKRCAHCWTDAYARFLTAVKSGTPEFKLSHIKERNRIAFDMDCEALAKHHTEKEVAAFCEIWARIDAALERRRAAYINNMLYGTGEPLGIVDSADNAAKTITLTRASWQPGLWIGRAGRSLEIRSDDAATVRVTAAIAGTDMQNQTLRFAQDADLSAVQAGDHIYLPQNNEQEAR